MYDYDLLEPLEERTYDILSVYYSAKSHKIESNDKLRHCISN